MLRGMNATDLPSDRRRKGRMATDEGKGITDKVTNTVRQTTGALRGEGPWYSANSEVYHNNPNCQTGNRLDPENVHRGRAASCCARSASVSTARAARWATLPACRSEDQLPTKARILRRPEGLRDEPSLRVACAVL